ncbi:MAG: type VI secretion system tip protein VgrG, partial [Myxococcales bacterium]|nr:type VI secretion system tip protein VgrG [Myxococcales bacterium]
MTKEYKQDNLGLQVTSPLGDNVLLLRALHGEDRLSGLFHYELELYSQKSDLDMTKVVGEPMTAKIAHPGGVYHINGVVSRFVQAGTSQRFTTYYAELRPWLWMLTHVTDSRIFQEKSVTDIIKAVFDVNGFSDYKLSVQGTYNPREYCVQYQETSFDFVSRLMEEEG